MARPDPAGGADPRRAVRYGTAVRNYFEATSQRIFSRRSPRNTNKVRLLLIQTTDLDAGRPVIWNVGSIAASGNPRALDLLRHIMLASASIPAAFPPVMFDVEAKGQAFQELHVDGGAVSQAFLVPPSVNTREGLKASGYTRRGALLPLISSAIRG